MYVYIIILYIYNIYNYIIYIYIYVDVKPLFPLKPASCIFSFVQKSVLYGRGAEDFAATRNPCSYCHTWVRVNYNDLTGMMGSRW